MSIPEDIIDATAQRFQERHAPRSATVSKIQAAHTTPGGLLTVDAPDRVRLRSQHLLRQPVVRAAIGTTATEDNVLDDDAVLLERFIGNNNLLGIAFLELGAAVSRSVGKIHIRAHGAHRGFGTGFMVSPQLAMTNNHVLRDPETARSSRIEFDFQHGTDGLPLQSHHFEFDPDTFFLTDTDLDCTVVAVRPEAITRPGVTPVSLRTFGYHRTTAQQGKLVLGESINIVQHPEGREKQISMQQNELVDRLEHFLHYHTDTAPGSSGSPLYNNQWEVVGLHHSGVPAKNEAGEILALDGAVWTKDQGETAVQWVANEGARMSSIHAWLRTTTSSLPEAAQEMIEELLDPAAPISVPEVMSTPGGTAAPIEPTVPLHDQEVSQPHVPSAEPAAPSVPRPELTPEVSNSSANGGVSITVPLHIDLRLGDMPQHVSEEISIDQDYTNRSGYDPDFLSWPVALPALTQQQRARTAVNLRPRPSADPAVVDYHHFSLVIDAPRRLALYTAVNIDGDRSRRPDRDRDSWFFDPRIIREVQIGNELYSRNDFDRGHLVRRLDPAWGSDAEARHANDDTFHYTNCAPQHMNFNQNASTWLGLEDYILNQAKAERSRITVFTGPVLDESDPRYRGVKIPLAFWKIVSFQHIERRNSSTAYLISQRDLVEEVIRAAFTPVTYQVPIRSIIEITGLGFTHLLPSDPLEEMLAKHVTLHDRFEGRVPGHAVSSFRDAIF